MLNMEAYPRATMERAVNVWDVMLQAMAKKITWRRAAEMLGISHRYLDLNVQHFHEKSNWSASFWVHAENMKWVPSPSRSVRRAGTTNACGRGFKRLGS